MRFKMNKSSLAVSLKHWWRDEFVSTLMLYRSRRRLWTGPVFFLLIWFKLAPFWEQFQWKANQTSPYDPRSNLLFSIYLTSRNVMRFQDDSWPALVIIYSSTIKYGNTKWKLFFAYNVYWLYSGSQLQWPHQPSQKFWYMRIIQLTTNNTRNWQY